MNRCLVPRVAAQRRLPEVLLLVAIQPLQVGLVRLLQVVRLLPLVGLVLLLLVAQMELQPERLAH